MRKNYILCLLFGVILAFSFAPFHIAGMAFLALMLLFNLVNNTRNLKVAFYYGFSFGFGIFGSGVSWVYNSIHSYGHLNFLISMLLTALFICYLAIFTATVTTFYVILKRENKIFNAAVFASLWTAFELIRGLAFTGFPWLNIGIGQIDSPLKYWLPVIGVYGVSFFVALLAAVFSYVIFSPTNKKFINLAYTAFAVSLLLSGNILKKVSFHKTDKISVAIIQQNLSMHDKWDENYFWNLLLTYEQAIDAAINSNIILLPESAIPVSINHVKNWLNNIDQKALINNTTILLGAIESTDSQNYYNSLMAIGATHGHYFKKQLVPFGEYIPTIFRGITDKLGIPDPDLRPGNLKQRPIVINDIKIASFICYEIAFDNIIRQQLPQGKFIVTITDSGWFGKSFAGYQLQQMSQVRSLQTKRYQILANNDGLSSVIDDQGNIIKELPRNESGILKGVLHSNDTVTIWSKFGNIPCEICISAIILFAMYKKIKKKTAVDLLPEARDAMLGSL